MNRIPDCNNVEEWAKNMVRLGFGIHLDDDPSEIVDTSSPEVLGPPLFSKDECEKINSIVSKFSDEQREEYHKVTVDELHRINQDHS